MYVTDVPVIDRLARPEANEADRALDALEQAIWDMDGGCDRDGCQPYTVPYEAYGAARDAIARLSDAVLTAS